VLASIFHSEVISKTRGSRSLINNLVVANLVFIALVALLLLIIIFVDTDLFTLPDVYYRILTASIIVDATLTILIAIFHRISGADPIKIISRAENNDASTENNQKTQRSILGSIGRVIVIIWVSLILISFGFTFLFGFGF